MADSDGLYQELRALSRGRGVPGSDLPSRLGPWIPGDRLQIETELRRRIELLAPDLALVALASLGLHPEIADRFLAGRLTALSARLGRDDRTVRRAIDQAFRLIAARPAPEIRGGGVTLEVCPIELLTDVDVLVCSGNTYVELAQSYKSSVAAALRRAAAGKGPAGEIVDDVLARELSAWTAEHSRPGLQVAPGTVIPLDPGALRSRGVHRVYYVAMAVAVPGSNDYSPAPESVAHAVSAVLETARADPAVRSVALPFLGAGRCGLPVETSALWTRTALEKDFSRGTPLRVHLVTRRPSYAPVLTPLLNSLPSFR
ncbi:hypothetical protein [Actinocorallia longicatena]|uniref:Macro domain-containing protein n=1 Tax=Actinocorallia longicatena TaxID=111803 RepID=A0ABP6Q1D8_9ACTN